MPDDRPAPKKVRFRPRFRWFSALALLAIVAAVLVVRSDRFARRVAKEVHDQVLAASGLDLTYGSVRFSPTTVAVQIRDIRLRRPLPGCAPLVTLESLEVIPSLGDLLRGNALLSRVVVDGGSVDLDFQRLAGGAVELRCGPVSRSTGGGGGGEVPLRDVAMSDVRVRLRHPDVGDFTLGSVDLDLLNLGRERWSVGLLAVSSVGRSPFFEGAIPRVEARITADLRTGVVYVASAQLLAGRTALRVRQARLDPATRHLSVDARVETHLEDVLVGIPSAPKLEGAVTLDVAGEVADLAAPQRSFRASVALTALGLGLHAPDQTTGEMLRYNLGDRISARVSADPSRVVVTDLSGGYAGATLRSDRISLGLAAPMPIEGVLSIRGLDFTQLMRDVTVTPRTKVLWTLSGDAHLSGGLSPMRLVADFPDMETREFAILRDYFIVLPQEPVVRVPRARISLRMEVDDVSVSWNDCVVAFGQSRASVRRIRVRTTHDTDDSDGHDTDIKIEGLEVQRLHLADLGSIADIPISGEGSASVALSSDFEHPRVHGVARIQGFTFNTFPFGDLATAPGTEWVLLDDRVDAARMEGTHRRSRYTIHDAYLDFRQYSLRAGARMHSDPMELGDFYNMFHFEGDPTFTPFDGRGVVDATVDYVLGRPGDDRDGVMTADVSIQRAQASAFGESINDVDARLSYVWLRRRDGVAGARVNLDHFTGTKGGAPIRASGAMDLGARMHFVAEVRDVPVASFDLVRESHVAASGRVSALVTVEGTPDAPRYIGDARFRDLVVYDRPIGDLVAHLSQLPEGPIPTRPDERPPIGRIDVSFGALSDQLRLDLTLRVPWEPVRWRDALGVTHPSWERSWGHSSVHTHVATRGPVDLLPWLPASMLARLGADARVTAGFDLAVDEGRLDQMALSTGRATLSSLDVQARGLPVALGPGSTLAVCFREGAVWVTPPDSTTCDARASGTAPSAAPPAFDLARPLLVGPDGTRLWVAGSANVTPAFGIASFDVRARGDADLSRVAARVPQLTFGRGVGVMNLRARGTPERPSVSGSVELHDASLGVSGLASPLREIEVDLRVDGTEAILRRASARYGQGQIAFTRPDSPAMVRFDGTRLDRLDVPIIVRDLSLEPGEGIELAADVDARLRWQGGEELPLLQGVVDLTRARYTRPIPLSADVAGRLQGRPAAAPVAYDPARDFVRLDVQFRTPTPMRIANNLADAELRLDETRPFRVVGTLQRPGIVGSMHITRGVLRVYENEFEVRRGVVDFDSPDRVAARFDISAQTEVRRTGDSARSQWRVGLHAHGTPEQFSVDLSAEPALSREDIVLMLLFRLTRVELERIGAFNAAQTLAVEALSRGLGLDRLLGRVLPVFDDVRIGSAYNPRTNRTEPQVFLGRQVFDWLRLGGSTTASENPIARFTADMRLRGGLGIQALVESANNQLGTVNANAGADLRWRMEFQ
ncbi:MAG: translocation/assembly module TamB domain-containing protein [Deltaproteobacteria bacterium]|nr:translocation/assembly module TamB domain-containing protein [Deltaproteobacteria bacterium]